MIIHKPIAPQSSAQSPADPSSSPSAGSMHALLGKYFRVRVVSSGLYFHAWAHTGLNDLRRYYEWPMRVPSKKNPGDRNYIEQHPSAPEDPLQQFWLFPADAHGDHWTLMLRDSVFAWDVDTTPNLWEGTRLSPTRMLLLWPDHGGPNQQFCFIPDGVDPAAYRISPKHDQNSVLDVYGDGMAAGGFIAKFMRTGGRNQEFVLEECGSFPLRPLRKPDGGPYDLGDSAIPKMKSEDDEPPGETAPMVVGETYLPFTLVEDPDLGVERQARESPLYIVRRELFWRRIGTFLLAKGTTKTQAVKVGTGIKREDHASVVLTKTLSLKSDLVELAKLPGRGLGASLEAELEVTIESKREYTEYREEAKQFEHKAEGPSRLAVWRMVDRFVIERGNGTEIARTEVLVSLDRAYGENDFPLQPPAADGSIEAAAVKRYNVVLKSGSNVTGLKKGGHVEASSAVGLTKCKLSVDAIWLDGSNHQQWLLYLSGNPHPGFEVGKAANKQGFSRISWDDGSRVAEVVETLDG